MTADLLRFTRCLLASLTFCVTTAIAAQPLTRAASPASTKHSGQGSLPTSSKSNSAVQWNGLDPSVVKRASKGSSQKAPSFPAEHR